MEEKGQDSLTINDILDQLVRPPITQSPGTPPPRPVSQTPPPVNSGPPAPLPSTTAPSPLKTSTQTDIKLPQLGNQPVKVGGGPSVPSQNYQPQSAELRLSVRTMADDIDKIKKGQKPSAPEIKRIIPPNIPAQPKPQPPVIAPAPPKPQQLPPLSPPPAPRPVMPLRPPVPAPTPRLVIPPVRPPMSLPPIPPVTAVPPSAELKHYHPEKVVNDEEMLPPFLGAPIPKKVKKPTEEKVQYGLIARVIGSGMTTGILTTLVLAAGAYGLLYFFYLKEDASPVTPTPTPDIATATPVANELEIIFRNIAVVNFELPGQKQEAVSGLISFITNQNLLKKEFKRLNLTLPGQEQKISSFSDFMDNLSLDYPAELKNEIVANYLVLIYGQEELIESADSVPKRFVIITEIKDPGKTTETMRRWEQTLPEDLKELLGVDPAKQATETFLTNERRNTEIRYKNFPLPDKSIDYSLLTSLTNHHYLIISNSRESMYSPLDKLLGL